MPDCNLQHTKKLIVINDTNDRIEIAFAQATCRYDVAAPYTKSTVVHTIASNVGGGTFGVNDLCSEKGELIAATAGSVSVLVVEAGGTKYTYQDNYPECPDGAFRPNLGWRLTERQVVGIHGKIERRVVLEAIGDLESVPADQIGRVAPSDK